MKNDLTKRELQVLSLIAKGYGSKKIASLLSISVRTIETHRKNIKLKFEFNNFYRVISYAYENKILPLDPTS
ncbi:MAG: helix-turn-helix transcriptional regulator [Chitinophagales bacterium]|tara:strand:+ start:139 stop:354 length:216 start_codon:yes stop_codon:yes gene_type:complete